MISASPPVARVIRSVRRSRRAARRGIASAAGTMVLMVASMHRKRRRPATAHIPVRRQSNARAATAHPPYPHARVPRSRTKTRVGRNLKSSVSVCWIVRMITLVPRICIARMSTCPKARLRSACRVRRSSRRGGPGRTMSRVWAPSSDPSPNAQPGGARAAA